MTRLFRSQLAAAALAALFAGPGSAATFSDAFFFGDSLSDTGNIYSILGGAFPTEPYYNGRFSNGPVWVEYLAAGIGHADAAKALLQGGHNFAFGGALTGGGLIPSVVTQVSILTNAVPALDPNALYVVAAGGNDMRAARSSDPANIGAAATAAADNLKTALGLLAGKGAKNVLMANLPDLGATPEAAQLGLVDLSTQATKAFNAQLGGVVSYGSNLGLHMSFFDLDGLASIVRTNGSVIGLTNTTTPCGTFQGSIGISCSASLFSDALHPSAISHLLAGVVAIATVNATTTTTATTAAALALAVPEPQTYGLMALGLGVIGAVARRRRNA